MNKYNIGDKMWYAHREAKEKAIDCPDCFGKKYLTVIKGDDSRVTIDCSGCSRGYMPPAGFVTYYEHSASVEEITIQGMDIDPSGKTSYKFNATSCSWRNADESELFATKEEAEKRAIELSEEHNKRELARINLKEKDGRTWSFNACYHRKGIKQAEKDLAYHTDKLNVAKQHSKIKEPI